MIFYLQAHLNQYSQVSEVIAGQGQGWFYSTDVIAGLNNLGLLKPF